MATVRVRIHTILEDHFSGDIRIIHTIRRITIHTTRIIHVIRVTRVIHTIRIDLKAPFGYTSVSRTVLFYKDSSQMNRCPHLNMQAFKACPYLTNLFSKCDS